MHSVVLYTSTISYFPTNHIIQSSSRSVKTVSVQYCTHKQLQISQITKPGATDFVSSIYSHSPTYVRVVFHRTLHMSEFPYIQSSFFFISCAKMTKVWFKM